jgi:Tol biopolymer transport system component
VSARSGEGEIWRSDLSGAGAIQLTFMGLNPGWPRWSPDGQQVAFHSNGEGGNGDIFVVPAEGGRPRNLTSHPSIDTFPSFSRDGRSIYFSSTRSGRPMIWKIPIAGGSATQVTAGPGMMAIESVDGTHIYYTDGASTNAPASLWRVAVAGGAAAKMVDGVVSTSFDVVDRGIYYIERLPDGTRLQFFDFESAKATTVTANLTNVEFGLGASPDGRTIVFTRTDSSVNDLMLVEHFR